MKQALIRIFPPVFRAKSLRFLETPWFFQGKRALLRSFIPAFGFFLLLNSLNGCQQPSSGGDQQQGGQHKGDKRQGDQQKQVPSQNQKGKAGNRSRQNDAAHAADEVLDLDPIDRQAEHLIYTRHARCRMGCRHITEVEIREILQNGEINYHKSELRSHPDPKYALEGHTKEGQHLRVVFAPSDRGLVVITCIELGIEWQCDCH
ncbi:DUF4258 domain-containing protein [Flavitalea flava]